MGEEIGHKILELQKKNFEAPDEVKTPFEKGRIESVQLGGLTFSPKPSSAGSTKEEEMAGVEKKSWDSPDETRTPDKTKVEVVQLGSTTAARFTFQPGWKWSECIKPTVGTDSCQSRHVGAIISGTLHVEHEDGSQGDAGPGDAYVIEPGHDAWVLGDDPVVALEFESKSAAEYAKG